MATWDARLADALLAAAPLRVNALLRSLTRLNYASERRAVVLTGAFLLLLGCAGVSAVLVGLMGGWWRVVAGGSYATALAYFHMMEFVWSATFQKGSANRESFLLTQNYPMYQMALTAAVCEFVILGRYAPSLCRAWNVCLGAAMVVAGQAIRSKGMWTAGVSFTHVIATTQRAEHVLVTHGIYSVLRHPSYFGWFWWSIGSQIMLGNPLCTCLYAYVSWAFFADRIPYEEFTLYQFFGPAYAAYARGTHIGIPFIKGLSLATAAAPRALNAAGEPVTPAPAPVPA